MLDIASQHISDGLDAAVRMPGEALYIILRAIIAEIVHHQERIGERGITEAEDALQVDARAFNVGRGAGDVLYGADGHDVSPFDWLVESNLGLLKHRQQV